MIQSYRIYKKINQLDVKYLYQLMNDMDNPLMKDLIMNRLKAYVLKNEIKEVLINGQYLEVFKKTKNLLELDCSYFVQSQEILHKTQG